MMPTGSRRATAVLAGLLAAALLVTGCASSAGAPSADDEPLTGAQWRTSARAGVGSATTDAPVRLTEVTVQEHERFDRLILNFDAGRAGYLVTYRDDPSTLWVTLHHVSFEGRLHATPGAAAITELSAPAQTGSADDVVIHVTTGVGSPLAFSVGLSSDVFYVDIAHPGQVPPSAS
jgi:hypothetical protein